MPCKVCCASFHRESSLPAFWLSKGCGASDDPGHQSLVGSILTTELVRWLTSDEAACAEHMGEIGQAVANPAEQCRRDKA